MATEIERKFLVSGNGWKEQSHTSRSIRQAYLARTDAAAIRVRITDGQAAYLTIKSAEPGTTRAEFEYPIPVDDAERMLGLHVGVLIEKRRYIVPVGTLEWEVDVFEGTYRGLIIAEIELPDAGTSFERPNWLGTEVTDDVRYYNSSLATDNSRSVIANLRKTT